MANKPLRWLLGHEGQSAARIKPANNVLVIGLGRFGASLAETLVDIDLEVMAIDVDPELVQTWMPRLSHVREADATNPEVLKQLGASDFDVAVVAIGTDMEASILTTAALSDIGVPVIWAKALSDEHGRILERVGAHHVVYPEKQMGSRVAHAVSGQMVDYFELDAGFVIAEVRPPAGLIGMTLAESSLRQTHNVTVVALKPSGENFSFADGESIIGAEDLVVVAGSVKAVERFAALA